MERIQATGSFTVYVGASCLIYVTANDHIVFQIQSSRSSTTYANSNAGT